jgi:nucleobase:cation symporter-1, NCS1 family
MSSVTADRLEATEVAEHSLLPVPDSARTSTAGHQFWIWAGANTAPINWVLGALGIQIGLGLWQTVTVLVLGNLLGMGVFGLFALMGQRTGVSQMVLSRVAFGRRGAYLPALFQGLLAVGWCAVNTWIILDLVMALLDRLGVPGSTGLKIAVAVVIMVLQVVIAAIGFRAIARFERWTVPVTLAVLLAMTVVAWSTSGVKWGYAGGHLHGAALWSALSTIMTAIGIGWGITWFAYASDYSRFVPRAMPPARLYVASFLGQFLPTVWLGVFGATLATVAQDVDPGQLVVQNFGALAIPVILLVIHGPIATNVLNIYSCALCAQTLDWKVDRRLLSYVVGALALAFTIFLVLRGQFASDLDAWLAGLVTWVAPWGTIVLISYYRVQRRRVDVPALFDEPGRSRRLVDVSAPAVIAFVVGMVATWSAEYGIPTYLQGPLAKAMGGVDLSWLVGSVVAGAVYLLLRPRPTALPGASATAATAAATAPAGEPV